MADDPEQLARVVGGLPRPLLLALDVDGVLSRLVDHADDARLTDGVGDALARLAGRPDVHVAVLSGRSLDGLRQFDFDPAVIVIGSHGSEVEGDPTPVLSVAQAQCLADLGDLARRGASDAGEGAWVEYKPTSVVLHVRRAPPSTAGAALDATVRVAGELSDVTIKPGSAVVELMASPADKGRALVALRQRHAPSTTIFVGDDITDEDAFRVLDRTDIGIKVGEGDTAARHRLASPDAVATWLSHLK